MHNPTADICNSIKNAAIKINSYFGNNTLYNNIKQKNVYNEDVKKIDELANDTLIDELGKNPHILGIASEELETPVLFKGNIRTAKYIICVDPLDGSANVDFNASTGTIFGVYKINQNDPYSVDNFLQSGRNLVMSGYVIYGSILNMIVATDGKVSEYLIKGDSFYLQKSNIKCPEQSKILSINAGNFNKWDDKIKQWFNDSLNQDYSFRYSGALISDVFRVLLSGGIFVYPYDKTGKAKLRLLYEANPIAYIIEQAGGLSIDGKNPILDLIPKTIHDTTGLICGSKQNVNSFPIV